MSFVKLIEFSDRRIREEIGDYYIISKDRIENIRNNFDRLREDKQKLKDILQELVEEAEWRDEVGKFYNEPKLIAGLTNSGWDDIFSEEDCRTSDAEATYHAALAAAKEG